MIPLRIANQFQILASRQCEKPIEFTWFPLWGLQDVAWAWVAEVHIRATDGDLSLSARVQTKELFALKWLINYQILAGRRNLIKSLRGSLEMLKGAQNNFFVYAGKTISLSTNNSFVYVDKKVHHLLHMVYK